MSGVVDDKLRTEPIRVAHVITDLMTGGAEMMLYRLLRAGQRNGFRSLVISLKQMHPVGDKIAALGIPVRTLAISRWPSPVKVLKLTGWLREFQPQVVQTWLPHADLLGGMAARLSGSGKVAWGIHFGKLNSQTHGRIAKWISELNAKLSTQVPAAIVCCSETSKRELGALGYDQRKLQVIPNGFDLQEFSPNPAARQQVLQEFQLPNQAQLIVHVGRYHPQKDYPTLLSALAAVMVHTPNVYALLCGRHITRDNATLTEQIGAHSERILRLGERNDIRRLVAAADVCVSSSQNGEAFPLVLGEAMAAGTPCVSTDCGDSALLVGDTGKIVPTAAPAALAAALVEILQLDPADRAALGHKARQRIADHFSLQLACDKYEALYRELALTA